MAGQIAVVRRTRLEEAVSCCNVRFGVRALEVRTLEMRVALVDADPGERIDDALNPLRLITCLVGVFDAEDERAFEAPGERPVHQRRPGASDMKEAGR